MQHTLYQILGVDPSASFEDIEIAFGDRFEELQVATIQDPNKLRVLNQAFEILSDVNRRAAYDASLTAPASRPRRVDDRDPAKPGFLRSSGKWIAAFAAVIVIGVWWTNRTSAPPNPQPLPPVNAPSEPESELAPEPAPELATQPGKPEAAAQAPSETPTAREDVPPVAAEQPAAVATANPLVGRWSCFNPVSGRAIRYDFQADGMLSINDPDGKVVEHKYEVNGRTVTLTDADRSNTLTIEEMAPHKMVLNTGSAGRRLACTR